MRAKRMCMTEHRDHLDEKNDENVLEYIRAVPPADMWALEITKDGRSARLHLHRKEVIAAQYGPLIGNGALMAVAGWRYPRIRLVPAAKDVQRNTSLSIAEVRNELSRQSSPAVVEQCDEVAALKQAILLIYQFRYKQAGAKLGEILKYNRFNYIAWLWYSRIVGKPESILRTLNEAQKWGNADREVILENRRNKALLITDLQTVKRCPFCWTVLTDDPYRCSYCCSRLRIQGGSSAEPTKHDVIEAAVGRYQRIFSRDQKNGQVAYCLALGYFNLDNLDQALRYLRLVGLLSPGGQTYRTEMEYIESRQVRRQAPSVQAPVAIGQPVKKPPAPGGDQKSILVIEDSQTSRKVISMVLSRAGFQILEASTGLEGIKLGDENTPSLVLLDVMLPDMNGYEILPQIKAMSHLADVPVIMLTGRTGSTDRVMGMRAGASEYLTKPFNPQKLVEILKKYL